MNLLIELFLNLCRNFCLETGLNLLTLFWSIIIGVRYLRLFIFVAYSARVFTAAVNTAHCFVAICTYKEVLIIIQCFVR